MTSWVHVAELRELSRRKKKLVVVEGRAIALFLLDDEVHAIDDVCGHKQRSLVKGTVLDGQVICPGHQWKFDPRTGQAEDQALCQPVFAVQVTDDGRILLDPVPRVSTPRGTVAVPEAPHEASEVSP
ncbi:Rieske 2Fe-2S domain-containing protein [Rhodococcus sp. X156]|uniref:Rieske (2Fe-2S) protein n=1 Tax=Rhodococcus sp. X156 TaxID=2499145 RepID=UPI000FDA6E1B|nr:Rieske 2Fe-2S domain-containing protein [Rhodococcus sp. X156]